MRHPHRKFRIRSSAPTRLKLKISRFPPALLLRRRATMRQTLNIIFKKVLADTDVKTLKAANGLQLLQDALTKGCDTELHTKNVKAVLLTDFVVQTRDT